MLVLERKHGQKIRIGDSITIQVVRAGERVKLAIEAPKEVKILREEIAGKERGAA